MPVRVIKFVHVADKRLTFFVCSLSESRVFMTSLENKLQIHMRRIILVMTVIVIPGEYDLGRGVFIYYCLM